MKTDNGFDVMAYGIYYVFDDEKEMKKLNMKRVELLSKLNELVQVKNLSDDEVVFVSQQLDKIITSITLILNNLISDDEYDMYLMFCDVYNVQAIEKNLLSRKSIQKIMLNVLKSKTER